MNGAFYIAATGLRAQQTALDVIANNVANVNTAAFKRSEVRFSELVATPPPDNVDAPPSNSDGGGGLMGVSATSGARVMSPGDLRTTGHPTDLAIDGDGFIELLGPAGQLLLWRGGALEVNADGNLAAQNGMALRAMIQVVAGTTNLTIGRDGVVSGLLPGDAAPTRLGQINLVLAKDSATLVGAGDGLYQASSEDDVMSASPGVDGAGALAQGSIEASNVQLTDEMLLLLLTQRAYAANAQVVQASDQLMGIANGLRR